MKNLLRKVTWPLAYSLGPKVLAGVKFLLLTRLLGPTEFGSYAFALIWITVTEGLSEFGFRQALVQQKTEPDPQEIWAINTMLLLRGLAVAPLMLGLGYLLHRWMTAVDLVTIAWICLLPCFRSLYTVSTSIALRHLDYRRLFYFEATWRGLDLLLTFLVVFLVQRSSRAAVASTAVAEFGALILATWILDNRLRFARNLEPARQAIRYGRWIWGQSFVIVLMNQFDKVFVVGRFGSQAMGGYQGMARLLQLVIADPVIMFTNVWFPKVAQDLRQSPEEARRSFAELVQLLSLALAVLIGLLVLGKAYLVRFVFGPAWLPYAGLVPIFGSSMALGSLINVLVTWHRAEGTPRMVTVATLGQAVVYVLAILWFGSHWGYAGVARAVNLSLLMVVPLLIFSLGHGLPGTMLKQFGLPLLWVLGIVASLEGEGAFWMSFVLVALAAVLLVRDIWRKWLLISPRVAQVRVP